MYGMTHFEKTFSDKLTNLMIDDVGFNQSKCQMSLYYNYAPDVSNLVVLSYVDYCLYWYTSEKLVKWFVDKIEKIFHVDFLGYAHWFMSIRTPQIKDHYISVYQARYDTFVVVNYLDTTAIK